MQKDRIYSILFRVGIVLIAFMLVGVVGWYVFLKRQEITLSQFLSARGIGSETPISAPTGSTRNNLLSGFLGNIIGNRDTDTPTQHAAPRLWQVSGSPATALHFSQNATNTTLFFAERPTGNLFAATASTSEILRISNTTIPHVYEGVWVGDTRILLQQLEENVITTFAGVVTTASSTKEADEVSVGALSGSYLEPNILALAVSPSGSQVFSLHTQGNGVLGIITKPDGSDAKRIWEFPIRGWNVRWDNPNTLTLVQYAARGELGSAYSLQTNGSLTPILTGIPGLSLIQHSDGTLLYSSADTSGIALSIQTPENQTTPLPIRTIAEKCIWGSREKAIAYCAVPTTAPSDAYPDSWYRGEENTVDAIWRIDTREGAVLRIFDSRTDSRSGLDILNLTIDDSGEYLGFLDARTRTPWMLKIEN